MFMGERGLRRLRHDPKVRVIAQYGLVAGVVAVLGMFVTLYLARFSDFGWY
jgi:hypothetical protein